MTVLLLTVSLDTLLDTLALLISEGFSAGLDSTEGVLRVTVPSEVVDEATARLGLLGAVSVEGQGASVDAGAVEGVEGAADAGAEGEASNVEGEASSVEGEASSVEAAEPEPEPEPQPVACVLHLWGEDPYALVERGADIARGGLMGKVAAYQNPPTGFIGDHWTLRFTTTMLEDIGVVASEIPVSWALYVDGVWAAGTDTPADAGVVGSIESTDAAPVASGKKGKRK